MANLEEARTAKKHFIRKYWSNPAVRGIRIGSGTNPHDYIIEVNLGKEKPETLPDSINGVRVVYLNTNKFF